MHLALTADASLVAALVLNELQSPEWAQAQWATGAPILVVHRVMVSPRHQGKGIARDLMHFAENWGAARGYGAIRLDAFCANPRALRLYQGLGHDDVGGASFRKEPFRCFEKRLGTAVERRLPDNVHMRLMTLTAWKQLYLIVTRLLAPLCAALALLFFYDVVATPVETDTARVVAKTQRLRRATRVFVIEAKGRYSYSEDVSARIFRTIQVGDTIHVSLTPVFTEWKTMEVVHNGTVVAATRGWRELSGMVAMGFFLLVGLAAFLPERILFPERLISAHPRITVLVVTVPVVGFVAVLLASRLVLVWMGQIEKV
jgi:hypothetical protein